MENDGAACRRHGGLAESIEREIRSVKNPAADVKPNMLRVPHHIKQLNPQAYKPRVISIGPLHHGQPELLPMEAFKKRRALNFILTYSVNIDALIDTIKQCEEQLRNDYGICSDTIPSPEFVKIMLIDGTFLVEFFLSPHFGMRGDKMMADILLLENQIPLYYLRQVLTFANGRIELVELLADFIRSTAFCLMVGYRPISNHTKHLLDGLRMQMRMDYSAGGRRLPIKSNTTPLTISKLHRAGIKFRPSRTAKVTFQRGILQLPRFIIDENTTSYLSNLLALEISQDADCYATESIAIMDYLIDGPEDVRILVQNNVVYNFVENDEAAANLINEIGKFADVPPDFGYWEIAMRLNAYCERRWVRWKSMYIFEWKRELKRNYFNNPWTTLSLIAAIILLGLTVIQTVCSLLQLNN